MSSDRTVRAHFTDSSSSALLLLCLSALVQLEDPPWVVSVDNGCPLTLPHPQQTRRCICKIHWPDSRVSIALSPNTCGCCDNTILNLPTLHASSQHWSQRFMSEEQSDTWHKEPHTHMFEAKNTLRFTVSEFNFLKLFIFRKAWSPKTKYYSISLILRSKRFM